MTPPKTNPWLRSTDPFFVQFLVDVKLWFFCVLLLLSGRIAFLITLSDYLTIEAGLNNSLTSLLYGLRYDVKVATRWMLPLILLEILLIFKPWENILGIFRKFWGGFMIVISITLTIVSIDYYKEYHDAFNEELFGLIYDDAQAIFLTLVKSYDLPLKISIIFIASLFLYYLYHKWLLKQSNRPTKLAFLWQGRWRKTGYFVLVVLFVILGLRGSWHSRPAQIKDAGIFKDRLLNLVVLNPFVTLRNTFKVHAAIKSSDHGLATFRADKDIRAVLRDHFETDQNLSNLDDYFIQHASGPKGPHEVAPRHIIVLIMESYASWAMQERYRPLGIANGLQQLAAQGLWWQSFLPASIGTMHSLATMITGIPDVHVQTNYQPTSKQPYPTAAATIFKRLGYQTNFFYGGFLSWQNLNTFAHNQGFNSVYGASHITQWEQTNEWGVDDQALFEFVETKLPDDSPSFSIILSTTNHPPFDLDLSKAGFPLKKLPAILGKPLDQPKHDKEYLNKIGHFWYADQAMLTFVRRLEKKLPLTLFAITGDHYGRKHPMNNPSLYESSSVPLVLYGKEVLKEVNTPTLEGGSQVDLLPTLIELAAPAGFAYHRIGRDLLGTHRLGAHRLSAGQRELGNAYKRIIGANFIFDVPNQHFEAIPGKPLITPYTKAQLTDMYNRQSAIAWWRIRKGNVLPPLNRDKQEKSDKK